MRRAAIVAPVRTAVGTFGGSLRPLRAEDLAAKVVEATVQRSGVDPGRIEDVVFARSMSNIEHYTTSARWGARSGNQMLYDRLDRGRERSQPAWRFGEMSGMIETAENLASDYGIDREAADAFAARSHQRAAAATNSGVFDNEIVAVEVPQRRGEPVTFDRDEGIRPDTTTATLAKLRTVTPGGTVTGGNSSQQNDAAAACLVVAEDCLDELGLEPIGFLEGWAAMGCEPSRMGIGPVGAVEKLFSRTGVGFDDLSLIEINEAFAVQVLAVLSGWGVKLEDVDDRVL